MSVFDYSTSPAANNAISGINISEGWPPRNVNDAFRQLMADIAVFAQMSNNYIDVTKKPYLADNTGTTDASIAIQQAYNDAAVQKKNLYVPGGFYRMDNKVLMRPNAYLSYASVFTPGPRILGAGSGLTIFDNRVSNGYVFDLDTPQDHAAAFKGVLGGLLQGFSIIRTTTTTNGGGILVRTVYNLKFYDVHVYNQSGTGIRVPCTVGDNDASNMMYLHHVRIDGCAGWGMDYGDPGHNENSFLRMEQVFIQACGTTAAGYTPTSGGMKFSGQILAQIAGAYTINSNAALYIPGQAGLSANVALDSTTFENNRGKHLFCTGLKLLRGRNLQIYNNDANVATHGFHFDFNSFVGDEIKIDGVLVRATAANNPFTAFKVEGALRVRDTIRITGVRWDNFDFVGQKRFEGVDFDLPRRDCRLVVADATTLLLAPRGGRGNRIATRMAGPLTATPGTPARSTTGELVSRYVAEGGIALTKATAIDRATGAAPAPNTTLYVYSYDDANVMRIGLDSGSGPVRDDEPGMDLSGTGLMVRSGDRTWLYEYTVRTDGSGNFMTAGVGHLNPEVVYDGSDSSNSPYYRWRDATGKTRVNNAFPATNTSGTLIGAEA